MLFGRSAQNARIICNLGSGGTNPSEIRGLLARGHEVRQCDLLHAKVFIGHRMALVTSANASANGLGLEGIEQASWIEAGVCLTEIDELRAWFDTLWSNTVLVKTISRSDLDQAEVTWRNRQRQRPSLQSFSYFDPYAEQLPLVTWFGNDPYEIDVKNVKAELGYYSAELEKRIEESVEIEHPEDAGLLKDTWVLIWSRTSKGSPDRRRGAWWTYLGRAHLPKAIYYGNTKTRRVDLALPAESTPPAPFKLPDPKFLDVLCAVLQEKRYEPFCTDDYEGPWFLPRRDLTRQLWMDLHTAYVRS